MRTLGTGDLRTRIVIEEPPTTKDASGGVYGDWSELCSLWANVRYGNSSSERDGAGTFLPRSTMTVTVRYRSGITTGMRVKIGDRAADIVAVEDYIERHRWLTLRCIEGPSHGN